MAGKQCPRCEQLTLFKTPTGRECSKCGYSIYSPPNDGKGGRGKKCPICEHYTIFNGKCTNCGAEENF